jgi:threonine dehydrogenase-like Zn-dependent dehydrogenase
VSVEDDEDGLVRVVYKDKDGNVIMDVHLNPGESATLPDGSVVVANADGTITQTAVPLGEVTVTATADPSTGEEALEAVNLAGDVQVVTYNGIQYATEAEAVLTGLGRGFTLVTVLAGGLPAAWKILKALFTGGEISFNDVVSLILALIAAAALIWGIGELAELLLAIGATMWDILQLAHH